MQSLSSGIGAAAARNGAFRVGLRPNLGRLLLLVLVSAFVGGMVGLERSILPVIAREEFGIASHAAAISFIATFGLTKAAMNLFAGTMSDRWGRRCCLIVGWLVGLPVPVIVMLAPDWSWVLFANVLLGVNQALTWSMAVNMKIDLAASHERGMAVGLNEFAGYTGLAVVALLTGLLAEKLGLRPAPFYLGIGLAAAGLVASLYARDVRAWDSEQRPAIPQPAGALGAQGAQERVSFTEVLRRGTWKDRALASASLGGLATNLKDGLLWGLLPLHLSTQGLDIAKIAVVASLYPAVWGLTQLAVGPLSDRVSRRWLVAAGLAVQGWGVSSFTLFDSYGGYLFAAVLAGLGTAMVYPTLQALVSDLSTPGTRASALGVYRFWRDLGYVVGALGVGYLADQIGIAPVFTACGILLAAAALVLIGRAQQSHSGVNR